MHTSYFASFFVSIFAITNPVGNLAIFIGLTSDYTRSQQRKTALVTGFAVLISLLLSLWLGIAILDAFGISVSAFEVAGGLIILLIGLSMLRAKKSEMSHSDKEHSAALDRPSVAVIPMAIPIVAGPGAMTTVIIAAKNFSSLGDKFILSGECLAMALIIAVIFFFAGFIGKVLGPSGVKITSRIMGLILAAIAISMMAEGLRGLFPVLAG